MHNRTLLSLILSASISSFAQTDKQDANDKLTSLPVASIPRTTLQFGEPEKTTLLTNGGSMAAQIVCSDDGSLLMELGDNLEDNSQPLTLHSLSPKGETVAFRPGHLPGYRTVSFPEKFFANRNNVVALVSGVPDRAFSSQSQRTADQLAVVYDRKGVVQRAVLLPDELVVNSVGIYGSGDLLVIGTSPPDEAARLLVIGQSGDVERRLSLSDEDYKLTFFNGDQAPPGAERSPCQATGGGTPTVRFQRRAPSVSTVSSAAASCPSGYAGWEQGSDENRNGPRDPAAEYRCVRAKPN